MLAPLFVDLIFKLLLVVLGSLSYVFHSSSGLLGLSTRKSKANVRIIFYKHKIFQ